MNKVVFDIEANDLLYGADRIWIVCLKELSSPNVLSFYKDTLDIGISILSKADILIGHNICMFDIPLLEKLYDFKYRGKLRDTYVMSKLFYPDRLSHSLESYGEQYGIKKPEHEDWSQLSEAMIHRCKQDVLINERTYKDLVERNCRDWDWVRAIEIEQQFAYDCALQELAGVDINEELAYDVVDRIDKETIEIDSKLKEMLPKKVKPFGVEVKKPFKKDGTYSKMVVDWWDKHENIFSQ